MQFCSTYPYLCTSLAMLAFSLLLFLMGGSFKRSMLLSGMLSMPFGFMSVFFVPAYWNPVRLIQWGAGIEDLFFSFANGVIVWFFVSWPVRHRLRLDIQIKRVLRRYLLCSVAGITGGLCLLHLGLAPMQVNTVGIVCMAGVLLWRHPTFLPLLVTGAITFGILYMVICYLAFMLCPTFLSQWNTAVLSAYTFGGIPIEEIIWSVGFGAVWPLFMAYAFQTQLESRKVNDGR